MTDKTNLGELWFYVRWVTGWIIDIMITVGGAVAMYWMYFFYLQHPLKGIPVVPESWMASPIVSSFVALGIFASFMAGRQWVRTQYFTHILPEVWHDTIQRFLKGDKKSSEKGTK